MSLKLYMHPLSTASRPVMLLCDEAGIDVENKIVDLMAGEQFGDAYRAINPSCQVPALVDGDFVMSESSAMMKYLADKVGSPLYPTDLRQRARVNERMDWFNTGFYREWGYHFVYPQVFDHHKRQPADCNEVTISWGMDKARSWMAILDGTYLASGRYVAGDEITIADLFGASIVTMAEWIGQGVDAWPNVARWIAAIKSRPSWNRVNEQHNGFVAMMAGNKFRTMA